MTYSNSDLNSKDFSQLAIKLVILVACLFVYQTSQASSDDKTKTEMAGDVLMLAIPAVGYGGTFYHDDSEGRNQFYKSFATNAITTKGLKQVINKERPNGEDEESFPSGHTSVAFQGASFIHQRYGLKYAIPAYIGASYVGYSRVKSDKHDVVDVLAGASLGILSSQYFTTAYKGNPITATPLVSADAFGLQVHYKF